MTRFPANDFMFPTAVVERSPKFFSWDAAAFILALVNEKERRRRRRRRTRETRGVKEKMEKTSERDEKRI